MDVLFNIISFALNSTVRADGNPKMASFTMVAGCLTNVILDYVFVFILNMGIKGFLEIILFQLNKNVKDTIGPHEKILKAIITKDSAKAEREMKKHIVLMETNLTLNIVTLEDE